MSDGWGVMKALVFTAPGEVAVQDVAEPVPGPDEVIVDVTVAGICGSDLHGVRHPGFRVPPLVLGHEVAGLVDGAPVAINPLVNCGQCDLCQRGLTYLCRHRILLGGQRPGALAERLAVPRRLVHPIPVGLSTDAAGMIEPLANAVHAWALANPEPGARVGIIGAGAIGLVTLLVAKSSKAASVSVSDPAESRCELAERLGADETGPELTGEFDVIFDAAGVPAARRDSVEKIRPGGTAMWIGLASADPAFDGQSLIRGEKRILSSFAYSDEEFVSAVDLVADLPLDWVTTVPLASGADVFRELYNGRTDLVKVLLRP